MWQKKGFIHEAAALCTSPCRFASSWNMSSFKPVLSQEKKHTKGSSWGGGGEHIYIYVLVPVQWVFVQVLVFALESLQVFG